MSGDLISRSELMELLGDAEQDALLEDECEAETIRKIIRLTKGIPAVDAVPMEDFKRLEKQAASLAKNNRSWRRKVQRLRSAWTKALQSQLHESYEQGKSEGAWEALQGLKDHVEVVRCRECKNRQLGLRYQGYYCARWDVDDYEEAVVNGDDFCSYGERKDNG